MNARETAMIGFASGKGGVGKTNLVANLAVAASRLGARVLVVDGDLGLANVDLLLGLTPGPDVADVLAGRASFEEALLEGPHGLRLLPATSGRGELPGLGPRGLAPLLAPLFRAAASQDLVLVDAGSGIGRSVVTLSAACDRVWLVTTPEPTALADAYATRKLLSREAPALPVELLVNRARDARDARSTHARLERLVERFLERALKFRGHLPMDPRVGDAVTRQRPVVEAYPAAPAAKALVALAQSLLGERPDPSPRPPAASCERVGSALPGEKP